MEAEDSLPRSQQPCLSQIRNVQPDSHLATQGTTLQRSGRSEPSTHSNCCGTLQADHPSYCVKINLKYMSIYELLLMSIIKRSDQVNRLKHLGGIKCLDCLHKM